MGLYTISFVSTVHAELVTITLFAFVYVRMGSKGGKSIVLPDGIR